MVARSTMLTLVVLGLVVLGAYVAVHHGAIDRIGRTDTKGFRAALACACFLSAFPIPTLFTASCIAAGFVCGLRVGCAIAIPATTIGMCACFHATRYLFRDSAQQYLATHLPDLAASTTNHSWVGIIGLRLLPVPFSFQNIFWASCTPVSFAEFGGFSTLVVVPHVAAMVFVGSSSNSMAEALRKRPSSWWLLLPVIVVVLVFVWRSRRRDAPVSTVETV